MEVGGSAFCGLPLPDLCGAVPCSLASGDHRDSKRTTRGKKRLDCRGIRCGPYSLLIDRARVECVSLVVVVRLCLHREAARVEPALSR